MANDRCVCFSKVVVYFVIFCHFVGGVLQIYNALQNRDLSDYTLWLILGAVLGILLGIILLAGAITENEKFVLAYLIITAPLIIFLTIGFIVTILSFGLQPAMIFIFLIILIGPWAIQYCVYVFYEYLFDKKQKLVNGGKSACDAIEECLDVFVIEEIS